MKRSFGADVPTHLLEVPLLLSRDGAAAFVVLLEAQAADHLAMLTAEELHQLMVVLAGPLKQVPDRFNQRVERKHGVHPMRLQVLLTERGHAGQAGLGGFRLHAGVTQDEAVLLCFGGFSRQFSLRPVDHLGAEALHDGAEDGVLLQVWSGGEDGPTLGAAEAAAVRPGHQETIVAEVVSTGDGDGTVEGAQTDAAGQVLLQLPQPGHDVTSGGQQEKRNLTEPGKRK